TNEPDLTVELYKKNIHRPVNADEIEKMGSDLARLTGQLPSEESFQKQLNIHIDRARLLLYNVSFNTLLQTLETSLNESEITTLRSYQQYLPITVASDREADLYEILETSMVETEADEDGMTEFLPLSSFVSTTTT